MIWLDRITRALRAGASTPRMAFGGPAQSLNYRPASEDTYSPALHTETTPNADGLALLQARRLALLTEARRHKNLRRSKRASICEAELRAVTHQILNTRRRNDA